MSSDELPDDVLFALTPSAIRAAPYWVQYYLKLSCELTAPRSISSYENFLVPGGSMQIVYELQSVSDGNIITDMNSAPASTFSTPSFTLPGTTGPTVTFDLISRAVIIPEPLIATAVTASDLFVNSDALPGIQAPVQYSQAFAFTVQLSNIVTRAYWRVRPALALLVVSSGTDIMSGGNTQSVVSSSAQLSTDFCGLNRPDLAGVWALVDAGTGSGARSEPDQLVDAGAWANGGGLTSSIFNISIADALDPELLRLLQRVVANHTVSIASLQADLLSDGTALGRAAVVPDSTGGFAVPMRNRFIVGEKTLESYALIFCTITITEPYVPLVAFGAFPAYTDANAALIDTSAVNNGYLSPIAVPGFVLDPVLGDALMYYFPAVPISTSGYICGDAAIIASGLDAAHAAVVVIMPATSAVCQKFLSPASRRRLLATATPLSVNTMQTSSPQPPVALPRMGVTLLTMPDPTASPPPPPHPNPSQAVQPPPPNTLHQPPTQFQSPSPHMDTPPPPVHSYPPPPPLGVTEGRSFSSPSMPPPPPPRTAATMNVTGTSSSGLAVGSLVAAIVVPVVCVLCLAGVLFAYYRRRKRVVRYHERRVSPQLQLL